MPLGWEPTTAQVAKYVPWLTISTSAPGSQTYLGNFTPATVPDDVAAGSHIADAVVTVSGMVGSPPGVLTATVQPLATVAAAYLAAYTLAIAYPRDPENDTARIEALGRLYAAALKTLLAAADNAGSAPLDARPVLFAPDPVPWGDTLL